MNIPPHLRMAITAMLVAASPALAQTVLIDYNFNSLTNGYPLAGQDGWVSFSSPGNAGPVVQTFTPTNLSAQQGAGWSTSGTGAAARAYRDFGDFNLMTGFTVTIEFDLVRVGSNAQAMLGIGSAVIATDIPPTVGTFSTGGWFIRGANEAPGVSAVDSLGNIIVPIRNNLYRVRSVWDLGASTASLAVMNLSAGATDFTALYFNAAQTQSTASLGTLGDVTLWDDLLVRTGGSNVTQGGFLDNAYVTTAPTLYEWGVGSGAWSSSNNWSNNAAAFNGGLLRFSGAGGASTNNALTNVSGLTFNSGAGSYTVSGDALTIGSAGITNNSANVQTVSNNLTLSTAMTASSASGAVVLAGTTALGSNTMTFAATAAMTNSGVISGSGPVVKTGTGTLTLSGAGANIYSGLTTIDAGTLNLNKSADTAAITGNVTLSASGATLLLSASGQVADTSAVTLSGGTIRRGGNVSEVFGGLNVDAASFLDFGADNAAGTLSFGTYTASALLTVQNFLPGNKLQFATGFNTALLPAGTPGNLSNADFSFSNGFTTGTEGGYFTITAVPEPSTYVAAAGLLVLLVLARRRRAPSHLRHK
jgi:autotransporter-associated beta strand protein